MNEQNLDDALGNAAEWIKSAEAIAIGAGAGMGVDSGLPDFRGNEGFWRAYPPFQGWEFSEVSNPVWFRKDPAQAWGFFGHRYHLYSQAEPHQGFQILRRWANNAPVGYSVFTSNVDGHFQRAGFDDQRIVECHGSIHHLQCTVCDTTWSADGLQIEVDLTTIRATSSLPECDDCGGLARPNILMFGDHSWNSQRTDNQTRRLLDWLNEIQSCRFVTIELGAGTAVPTVRYFCEETGGRLIRINPRDAEVPTGAISLPLPALEALTRLENLLNA